MDKQAGQWKRRWPAAMPGAGALVCAVPPPVWGQPAGDAPGPAELVVTAQRSSAPASKTSVPSDPHSDALRHVYRF